MNPIKVGVIGVGRMGQRHCRVYANLRRVQLAGLSDANAQFGRTIAAQYDVPFYTSLDELLANVDAVSLVTPTPQHFELAKQCIEHGVHVLIEKPITATLEEAEQLTKIAEASGLIVQIGHIERFNSAYMELKNALDGKQMLACEFRRQSPSEGSNVDVDVVLDLMIHDTNLVLDLMRGQMPDWIEARGLSVFSGTIDHAVAQVGYNSGQMFTLTASRITEAKVRSINVVAREAFLQCDLLTKSLDLHRHMTGEYLNQNHRGLKYRQESVVERIQVPFFEPLFLELQNFVDSVAENTAPLVTARDGYLALQLVEEIRQRVLEQMAYLEKPAQPMLARLGASVSHN